MQLPDRVQREKPMRRSYRLASISLLLVLSPEVVVSGGEFDGPLVPIRAPRPAPSATWVLPTGEMEEAGTPAFPPGAKQYRAAESWYLPYTQASNYPYPQQPAYYPQQPAYYPQQPAYYPQQPAYYPQQPPPLQPVFSYNPYSGGYHFQGYYGR